MHLLDNPAWAALTTFQAHLSVGGGLARRYADDIAPIAAVARRDDRAMEELAALVPAIDWLSMPATLDDLIPLVPPPLRVRVAKELVQMVCERRVDVDARGSELFVLSDSDVPEMLALVALTHPGPFRPRTHTLGTYLGIRVDGRLAAMGGQRMHLPGFRELSAICTHPDFRGHGYARTIVARVTTAIFDEGLTPFLHVEGSNHAAQALYRSMGYIERARLPLLVLERST